MIFEQINGPGVLLYDLATKTIFYLNGKCCNLKADPHTGVFTLNIAGQETELWFELGPVSIFCDANRTPVYRACIMPQP